MKLTRLLFISLVVNMVLFGSISVYMYKQLDDASSTVTPTRTTPDGGYDGNNPGDKPGEPIMEFIQDKDALYNKFSINDGEDVVFSF